MAYNVRISPVAKADVRKAVAYYKKEVSLKVAQNFVEDYELTLKKLNKTLFSKFITKIFELLHFQNIRTSSFIKSMRLTNSFS